MLRFGNVPNEPKSGDPVPLSGGFDAILDAHGLFREPLLHTQQGAFYWRGLLRPFAPPPRSDGFATRSAPEEFTDAQPDTPKDYSNATAFEIGRLLALANSGILEDLRGVKGKLQVIEPPKAINKLPAALQKHEWVVNDPWHEQPWQFE